MTDLPKRLRRLYVQDGTNYVQEAADEIERLRERQSSADMCLDAVTEARRVLREHFGGNLAFLDDDLVHGVVKMKEEIDRLTRERDEARAERDALAKALTFYAEKSHFVLSDDSAWDTVSGEPPNYWCDEAGTATVEDGAIARLVLAGAPVDLEDDEARAERDEVQTLCDKLAGILDRTVNTLRGDPPPLTLWGWHDLPELAEALRAERDALAKQGETFRRLVDACKLLSSEAEEYEFDDGMGRGAMLDYWHEFDRKLDAAIDAQIEQERSEQKEG